MDIGSSSRRPGPVRLGGWCLALALAGGCSLFTSLDDLQDGAATATASSAGASGGTGASGGGGAGGGPASVGGSGGSGGGPQICGNGVVEGTEPCDDGNDSDSDACLGSCAWARCGDGHVRAGVEACDDANEANDDGCTSRCVTCAGPDTFTAANGHCHFLVPDVLSWFAARDACANTLGDDLSSYDDGAESAGAGALVPDGAYAWFGLNDQSREGSFVWADRSTPMFSAFAPGEPGGGTGENCGAQRGDGGWHDYDCSNAPDPPHPVAYLCEDPGWVLDPATHHAYRIGRRVMTWSEAKAACESLGAHLAIVESEAEWTFLESLVHFNTWLGASETATEGDYQWIDGAPLGFEAWDMGQPNNAGGSEACLMAQGDGVWNDVACTVQIEVLCEVD